MSKLNRVKLLTTLLLFTLLSACGMMPGVFDDDDSAPTSIPDISQIPEPTPRHEPRSRYGNPSSYEVFGKQYYVMDSGKGYVQQGTASWYGTKFHGRKTSSGEAYDMFAFTAAHKTLPLPTYARVTNLDNGRSIIVKINDRGPFHGNRIIDLSYAAAHRLGIIGKGTGHVEVRAIDPSSPEPVVASNEPTAPVTSTTPAPAAQETTTADSGIYLQVGAFSQRGNAERLKLRLAEADIHAVQITANSNTLYKVRVGPMDNTDEADRLIPVLQALGVNNPRVTLD